jgi:DNA modification methylase
MPKRTARRRANQLDGKTWTRHSISIWSDIRKTPEETALKHPAMFPAALAQRIIQCFTAPGDQVIFDPFVGVGSTLLAAEREGKTGVGIELSPHFASIARRRLQQEPLPAPPQSRVIQDDARSLLDHLAPESVDLVVTSPPYWDILTRKRTADYKDVRSYGEDGADLGNIEDLGQFLEALRGVFRDCCAALRPGKYAVVIVMDLRKKARFYPYHQDVAAIMQDAGFIYDDLVIWDRRHEYNNLRPLGYPSVFRINKAHEFILIFRKPPAP